jgi:hypothetical protein
MPWKEFRNGGGFGMSLEMGGSGMSFDMVGFGMSLEMVFG